MPCEICNRNSCTRSFHNLDEQKDFDNQADSIKDRMKSELKRQIERLPDVCEDEKIVGVSLDYVLSIIDNY